jgi:hypothetical protein
VILFYLQKSKKAFYQVGLPRVASLFVFSVELFESFELSNDSNARYARVVYKFESSR